MLRICAELGCPRTFRSTKPRQYRCPDHQAAYERRRNRRQDASRKARGVPQGGRRVPRKLREVVLKRQGNRCAYAEHGWRCPASERLEVHHTDGNRLNNSLANLVALCALHHRRVEGRRTT